MIGDLVEIVEGESDGELFYTADMKLLIGKIGKIIEETADDVRIDIGDEDCGWRREWLKPV